MEKLSGAPWALPKENLIKELNSDADHGLSQTEAIGRLSLFGANELKAQEKENRFYRFLRQFKSPVVLTLLAAVIFSFSIGEKLDAIVILSILLVNAIIGFLQESKAEKALSALSAMTAPKARVWRDNKVVEIASRSVCIGDILILESGDLISADARLLQAHQMNVVEAILTGESMPIAKTSEPMPADAVLSDRKNMLFSGTHLISGYAKAIVVATGMKTEVGQIARMLNFAQVTQTPLQERLFSINNRLLYFCFALVVLVFAIGLYNGMDFKDIMMVSVSLSVAAIPEGLPTVVTLALALAVKRMSEKKALVRFLPAVETLGSTQVICSDKTGTLTKGQMTVTEYFDLNSGVQTVQNIKRTLELTQAMNSNLLISKICNNASATSGDPTEVALMTVADEIFNFKNLTVKHSKVFHQWIFDSERKRMSVAVHDQELNQMQVFVKGAPESLIELCLLSSSDRIKIEETLKELASKGRRVLALAKRTLAVQNFPEHVLIGLTASEIEKDLEFVGLVALADEPKEGVVEAVSECKSAGIKVIMITGDHPVTAKAIAMQLGILDQVTNKNISESVIEGSRLDSLSDGQLQELVADILVYARVTPLHKLRIVKALQASGLVVAMTGDGVNDAPALQQASIGISMGKGGTEVARQASAIILTDDNFSTIVSAVKEGRAVYGNIRRTIQYLLSGNLAELMIMMIAIFLTWPLPLLPIHLLWINLVTDGLPALALASEPVHAGVLRDSKGPSRKEFFDSHFWFELLLVGFLTALLTILTFRYFLHSKGEVIARTCAFTVLVFAELFRSFASRSERKNFWKLKWGSNVFHLFSVAVPFGLQLLILKISFLNEIFSVSNIDSIALGTLIGIAMIPAATIELYKYFNTQTSQQAGRSESFF